MERPERQEAWVTHREPGQPIEVSFLLADEPFLIMPVTVVADRDDLVSHYLADGTRYLRRVSVDGTPPPRVIPARDIGTVETRMTAGIWRGSHRLVVTRPGQAHAVFLKWTAPGWDFREWYVNLQEPLRRTVRGFETRDQFLDIQVAPDRTWQWKDEDELELAVELGRLTRAEADAVRREGERAILDIEARRFPFDDSLLDWRPDPAWIIPHIP
jgi:hypothetical protein